MSDPTDALDYYEKGHPKGDCVAYHDGCLCGEHHGKALASEVRRLTAALEEIRTTCQRGISPEPLSYQVADHALSSLPVDGAGKVVRVRRSKEFGEWWLDIEAKGKRASINLGNCHGPIVTSALLAALDEGGGE